jgi:hypothetical protein
MRSDSKWILLTSFVVVLGFTFTQLESTACAQSANGSRRDTEAQSAKTDDLAKALDTAVHRTSQAKPLPAFPQADPSTGNSGERRQKNKARKWILIAAAIGGGVVAATLVKNSSKSPQVPTILPTITAGNLSIGQPQ